MELRRRKLLLQIVVQDFRHTLALAVFRLGHIERQLLELSRPVLQLGRPLGDFAFQRRIQLTQGLLRLLTLRDVAGERLRNTRFPVRSCRESRQSASAYVNAVPAKCPRTSHTRVGSGPGWPCRKTPHRDSSFQRQVVGIRSISRTVFPRTTSQESTSELAESSIAGQAFLLYLGIPRQAFSNVPLHWFSLCAQMLFGLHALGDVHDDAEHTGRLAVGTRIGQTPRSTTQCTLPSGQRTLYSASQAE